MPNSCQIGDWFELGSSIDACRGSNAIAQTVNKTKPTIPGAPQSLPRPAPEVQTAPCGGSTIEPKPATACAVLWRMRREHDFGDRNMSPRMRATLRWEHDFRIFFRKIFRHTLERRHFKGTPRSHKESTSAVSTKLQGQQGKAIDEHECHPKMWTVLLWERGSPS